MTLYGLYARNSEKYEIISRVLAVSLTDAILLFCEQKKIDRKSLLSIFKVGKIQ